MSVVTVQLGQCGNQVGSQLFSTLYSDALAHQKLVKAYHDTSMERFFHMSPSYVPMPRAVLVDMESKVIQQTLSSARKQNTWSYDERCVYTQKRGSGNNWASGYNCHGPKVCNDILEMVQKQAEKCDLLSGFLVLMSVAGGTGSGVGTKISEEIRDFYPKSVLANQIVWPYNSGEVIVQDYNTLLTTAHLQRVSDIILLLENDQLHKVCSKLLHLKEITFKDINSVVCHSLANILQPCVNFDHFNQTTASCYDSIYDMCSLSSLQEILCPTPSHKIVSLKTIPQIPEGSHAYTRNLWPGLLRHIRQMLITNSPIEEGMDWGHDIRDQRLQKPTNPEQYEQFSVEHFNKSLANLIILRGNELNSVDTSNFTDPRLYSKSVPGCFTNSVWCNGLSFRGYEKTCSLVSNSQGCVRPLNSVCKKAWSMYTAKAYIHQYEKYGLQNDDFLNCFITMEQLIKNYACL